MKVKVPGAEASTGVKAIDWSLPKGDYVFEIGMPEVKESANSPCMIHAFPMVVIDGPDDDKTGKTTQGRKYTHRIIVLMPEHEKYDPNNTRSADEIADLCAAADVEIDRDGYEPEEFAGRKVKAKLGVRQGKDQDGNARPENVVNQQKDEDGTVHLWLSDDGKPMSNRNGKSKSPAKATAGKRR
jgi:hypothetical protein